MIIRKNGERGRGGAHTRKRGVFLASAFIHSLIFILVSIMLKREFLPGFADTDIADGFVAQLAFVQQALLTGDSAAYQEPLFFVHAIRLLIALPFLLRAQLGLPAFLDSVFLLGFLSPILFSSFGGRRYCRQHLFVYLGLFVSFRSMLVACAIGYLFLALYSNVRSKRNFVMSSVLAYLSTASMVGWLFICILFMRSLVQSLRSKAVVLAAILFVVGGIGASMIEKTRGFSEGGTGYEAAVETDSVAMRALSRNTIYSSIEEGNYLRAFSYLALVGAVAGLYARTLFQKTYRRLHWFFLAPLPLFAFEGLGPMAFLFPVCWVLFGVLQFRRGRVRRPKISRLVLSDSPLVVDQAK